MFEDSGENNTTFYSQKKDFILLMLLSFAVLICGIVIIFLSLPTKSLVEICLGICAIIAAIWLLCVSIKNFMHAPRKIISINNIGFEIKEYGFVSFENIEKIDMQDDGLYQIIWFKYKNDVECYKLKLYGNIKHIYNVMLYYKSKHDQEN